ncbi:hypothetical protein IAT40_005523 [Kwoniella sp. CBS 6097]
MTSSTPSKLPFHLVNAFTPSKFGGNQAAVVLFDSANDKRSKDEEWMRLIARDFNFSETAYLVPLDQGGYQEGSEEGSWGLRWFTPSEEVELCGHATLASASTLFTLYPSLQRIRFETRYSGTLTSTRVPDGKGIEIVLPSFSSDVLSTLGKGHTETRTRANEVAAALGVDVALVRDVSEIKFSGMPSIIVLLDSSIDLKGLKVDVKALGQVSGGWFVTQIASESDGHANDHAKGETDKLHINSRVFGPGLGIDEDPVTGSAHAYFTGYYLNSPASKFLPARFQSGSGSDSGSRPNVDLSKVEIVGRQVSERGGLLRCKWDNGKVRIVGQAVEFARGTLSS